MVKLFFVFLLSSLELNASSHPNFFCSSTLKTREGNKRWILSDQELDSKDDGGGLEVSRHFYKWMPIPVSCAADNGISDYLKSHDPG